jgi:hypothetical protein
MTTIHGDNCACFKCRTPNKKRPEIIRESECGSYLAIHIGFLEKGNAGVKNSDVNKFYFYFKEYNPAYNNGNSYYQRIELESPPTFIMKFLTQINQDKFIGAFSAKILKDFIMEEIDRKSGR